ncbi:MAG: hypothetical protein JWQ35_2147 [Bacteriovoracaceae bacterium]|nr:hypothetical protein [Bacteriovoracaceae bacterium]
MALKIINQDFRLLKLFSLFIIFLIPQFLLAKAERIESIVVQNNKKAKTDAILAKSGLFINQEITEVLLKEAKEKLGSNIIFEEVRVSQKPGSDSMHSIIVIWVKEKISWFVVPSFSFSEGTYSGGATYVESNLFGRFKRILLFADYGNQARHAVFAYRDPSLFSSAFILDFDGLIRLDQMREYEDRKEVRRVNVTEKGFTLLPGYQWSPHFSNSIGAYYRRIRQRLKSSEPGLRAVDLIEGNDNALLLKFNYSNTETFEGLTEGSTLELESQLSDGRFYSDFNYFKQILRFGNAFGLSHHRFNFATRASIQLARDLPFYYELMLGGDNLRGYLYREFRGDTKYTLQEEVTFPIFNFKKFILRGIGFWDSGIIYFSEHQFSRSAWRNGLGTGLRIYIKGIAIPIVGYDVGYGIEDKAFATYLTVGASF